MPTQANRRKGGYQPRTAIIVGPSFSLPVRPMNLRLHNSLTRRLEDFVPQNPQRVTMYVCGPTVYNYIHVGNARPAVVFGLLARLLRRRYSGVVYARNITDVDDKINAAAKEAGTGIEAITSRFARAYHEDMARLGVDVPDIVPHATEHIAEIIGMCESLIASGHAYAAEGHVLFEIATFPEYGQLSGRSAEDMLAGARVEVAPYKRSPGISCFGNPPPTTFPAGTVPGAAVAQAGISNARRWQRRIWAQPSTSMPAATT
jgi:cysteinyl-tRNA synthetase